MQKKYLFIRYKVPLTSRVTMKIYYKMYNNLFIYLLYRLSWFCLKTKCTLIPWTERIYCILHIADIYFNINLEMLNLLKRFSTYVHCTYISEITIIEDNMFKCNRWLHGGRQSTSQLSASMHIILFLILFYSIRFKQPYNKVLH